MTLNRHYGGSLLLTGVIDFVDRNVWFKVELITGFLGYWPISGILKPKVYQF